MSFEESDEETNHRHSSNTNPRKRAVARKRLQDGTHQHAITCKEMESFYLKKISIYKEEYDQALSERELKISELEASLSSINNINNGLEAKAAARIAGIEDSLVLIEESNLGLLISLRSAKARIKELEAKNDFYRRKIEIFMKDSAGDKEKPSEGS